MFLLLIGFVRFIRFNRLYTKPYPNPTVFIKLYPFGLYGIYQNQTILSISIRFGTVRFYHIEQPYRRLQLCLSKTREEDKNSSLG